MLSQYYFTQLFLEFKVESEPKFLSSKVAFPLISKKRILQTAIVDDLKLNIAVGLGHLLSFKKLPPDIRTRRRILSVAQLKADENLSIGLRPFKYGCGFEVVFGGHLQLLQHPLVGLQPIGDRPQHLLVVIFLMVVQLPEALDWLRYQLRLVCHRGWAGLHNCQQQCYDYHIRYNLNGLMPSSLLVGF